MSQHRMPPQEPQGPGPNDPRRAHVGAPRDEWTRPPDQLPPPRGLNSADGPPPPRKPSFFRRRWVQLLAAGLLGLFIGAAAAGGSETVTPPPTGETAETSAIRTDLEDREKTVQESEVAAQERQAQLDARQAELDAREAALVPAEQAAARSQVTDGFWTVGTDIEPGTYRVTEPVPTVDVGGCYWAIYETGTSGGDIIENDNPTGGFPTVVLAEGQDFESNRCGTWAKQ